MKAIIFGEGGQDGRFLRLLLQEHGIDVLGIGRTSGELTGDIAISEFVQSVLKRHKPDYVFHLAAASATRHSLLFENHNTISTGTLNVLEAVKLHSPKARVFLSGSALQFKNVGDPINEDTPFEASSPYALARIHSAYAGRYYRSTFGLTVYYGYFFNHDSEFRTEAHVNQRIANAVKRIEAGSNEPLQIGDIEVQKEFNFAGDIVDAIWKIVNQEKAFEVVIGCGTAHSIKEWIEYCFTKIRRNWRDHVKVQNDYKAEYARLVSDPALLYSLGWAPKVSFEQLADRMLESK
jgi:GDPmannose 4,6-dehydratase